MQNGYTTEYRLKIGSEPLWLQCCPWWLVRQPAIRDVSDAAFWAEQGNLGVIYASGDIPVILRDAVKSYSAGYHDGTDEYYESNRTK